MIDIIRSFIIGGIQGISEFLPISSSGHLVLIPYIFKWQYQGLLFDVMLHFGTLLAILAYFWRDWLEIIKSGFSHRRKIALESDKYPSSLLWQLVVASVPAAIAGYFLADLVEKYLHSPLLIAVNLIVFGLLLWLADRMIQKHESVRKMTFGKSFFVGLAQAVALMPGVSRSGITMTAGRLTGLSRKDSARYSFLLSAPAILGASIFEVKNITANDLNLVFLSGLIASTLFGFLAIKYLLQYLERGSFSVFVWYRIFVAAIIIALYFLR